MSSSTGHRNIREYYDVVVEPIEPKCHNHDPECHNKDHQITEKNDVRGRGDRAVRWNFERSSAVIRDALLHIRLACCLTW